jgi:hypothetical protein
VFLHDRIGPGVCAHDVAVLFAHIYLSSIFIAFVTVKMEFQFGSAAAKRWPPEIADNRGQAANHDISVMALYAPGTWTRQFLPVPA